MDLMSGQVTTTIHHRMPWAGIPDIALWDSPAVAGQWAALARYRRLAAMPLDHEGQPPGDLRL